MARLAAPSTIFIDEIDALCGSRGATGEHEASRRVKAELLTQMDGVAGGGGGGAAVMVLAATNFPWALDEALRRRLEKRILVPLPDVIARAALVRSALRGLKVEAGVDAEHVARRTPGYSCDDLTNVCRDAALGGMRRLVAGKSGDEIRRLRADQADTPVTAQDVDAALTRIGPSVAPGDMLKHEAWGREFGST